MDQNFKIRLNISNFLIFIVNFIFIQIFSLQMIQTLLKPQNMFLHQKAMSQKFNHKIIQDNKCGTKKSNKLRNLREISPKEFMGEQNFFLNLNKFNKHNLFFKQSQTLSTLSSNSLNFYIENKKLNSNYANRKQSENLSFNHSLQKITLITAQTQRYMPKTNITPQKSSSSTKARSQISTNQNISTDYFNDQKNIINIKQIKPEIIQNKQQNLKEQENNNPQKILQNKQLSIQHFDILNFCGEGVFGSVYIARHKQTKAIFALKKISKTNIIDEKDKQSLIRQIKIHLKLNHPNIIKFYGCFSNEKSLYFILELCYSGNLYELLLKNGPMKEDQVRNIIKQVCKALNYLHQKNIIHRDLKAENIVVHDNIVKICDFGWASQGQYSRKSLCGTPAYISPEVISNKLYDRKVDVWSTGILTFQLCFGKIPFDIKSQDDFQKIIQDQLIFPFDIQISDSCKDFIMKCLQKNSFKRWDTSRLLNHPFLKKD